MLLLLFHRLAHSSGRAYLQLARCVVVIVIAVIAVAVVRSKSSITYTWWLFSFMKLDMFLAQIATTLSLGSLKVIARINDNMH